MQSTTGGEAERIAFLEARDGREGALDFARRTLDRYRFFSRPWRDGSGCRRPHFPHDKTYRASFVLSIKYLRNYLRGNVS